MTTYPENMSTWQMCSARLDATNEGDGMNPRTRDSLLIEEMALAPGGSPFRVGVSGSLGPGSLRPERYTRYFCVVRWRCGRRS